MTVPTAIALRLSEAQKSLLEEVLRQGGGSCDPTYKPAQKLVALGLVNKREMKYSTWWLTITDAGRAALVAQEKRRG